MKIKFKSYYIGDDILILITGGKEHIGAVSFCDCDSFSTILKKGHKDDVISKMVAKKIYKKLQLDVVVICGIHFDNISKSQIEEIVKQVKRRTKKWIKKFNLKN
jgi:hypothetical protein